MKHIIFHADLFARPRDKARSEKIIRLLLDALLENDIDYLINHPNTPGIYKAKVRYQREKRTEEWKSIPFIIKDKQGDCEDLATWRAAELIVRYGVQARTELIYQKIGNTLQYHVIVALPNGQIEDPSRRLGM